MESHKPWQSETRILSAVIHVCSECVELYIQSCLHIKDKFCGKGGTRILHCILYKYIIGLVGRMQVHKSVC